MVEYGNEWKEGDIAIEFDSFIESKYIIEDGNGEEYHTTVTIFSPDVERDGDAFDYAEYLSENPSNDELDIIEESPMTESAIGETLATDSEKELSNAIIPQNSEKSTPKGQFSFKEDPSNNEKVGESVEKTVDNNKKPTSYTKAEAAEMVSGILTEF